MIDTFEIVKTIEKIYKEINLLETVKKKLSKRKFILIILPKIVCFIIFCILSIFTILNKCPIIYFIAAIGFVVSILLTLSFNKKYLEIEYGIHEKDDEIFYYKLFKKSILKNNITKEILIIAKNILEIETQEEKNYLSIYFVAYFSLILLPTMFIIFEEYIKKYIQVLLYMVLFALVLPIIMYLINFLFNRKINTKKVILKKIERLILEL